MSDWITDGPPPEVAMLVGLIVLFLLFATPPDYESQPDDRSHWQSATGAEVQSGKFDIKTGPGPRGGVMYWKKVH